MIRQMLRTVGLLTLSACAADAPLRPLSPEAEATANARALVGTWTQLHLVPGASFAFTVTADDSTVSGSGYYAIEAGRSGTMTVHGVAGARRTTLDFRYDSGTEAHFDGSPADGGLLEGGMRYGPRDALTPQYAVTLSQRR